MIDNISDLGSSDGLQFLKPNTINSIAIRRFCEETPNITMYSADTVTNEEGNDNINDNLYPIEFLNSLNVQGFPLHKLELQN